MEDKLRVLVVDDTVTYRSIISKALGAIPGLEVVGVAANGKIALQKIEQFRPDLLTLDVEMPEIDGLEVLRRLRAAKSELGVIMLSGATTEGTKATVEALELGAFDFVVKPGGGSATENADALQQALRLRISAWAKSREIRQMLGGVTRRNVTPAAPAERRHGDQPSPSARSYVAPLAGAKPKLAVLGISTGGPQALTRMLPELPATLRVPLLIVQHMPPVFTRSLADDLNRRCQLRVREACDGDPVVAGTILIAPGGRQMKIVSDGETPRVRLTDDPPENSCRPSVDYLFRSAAELFGGAALGIIMTGMGNDGNAGCRLLHRCGAPLLAEDEASCVVFGMPREPIAEGIAKPTSLDNMAREIVRVVEQGGRACG
jgi:two-component system, chemotaxis family, protein-glutamate methylesterase/glutaminase